MLQELRVDSSIYAVAPLLALGLFLIFLGHVGFRQPQPGAVIWPFTAAAAAAFAAWSLHALMSEGLDGVWAEHVRNAWSNQIWFDLLLAIGIAATLLLPRTRAVGMRTFPWLMLIVCTGCIGLLAMLARCQFLEGTHRRRKESTT